jgi:hypothetical protein
LASAIFFITGAATIKIFATSNYFGTALAGLRDCEKCLSGQTRMTICIHWFCFEIITWNFVFPEHFSGGKLRVVDSLRLMGRKNRLVNER